MEQKIFLQKEDDLEKAVAELTASPAERIVLNIPKNSVLGTSVHNFQVLEREGTTSGKELAIESVDEHILELASIATIPAVNPVFRVRETAVADIVPRPLKREDNEEEKPTKKTRAKSVRKTATVAKKPTTKKKDIFEEIIKKEESEITQYEKKEQEWEEEPKKIFENIRKPKKGLRFKLVALAVSVAVLGLGYWIAVAILPKADITVSIEKTTTPFTYQVSADTSVNSPSVNGKTIILPGQLSVAESNLNKNFLATGLSATSSKAGGTLTVFNSAGAGISLVANTRFQSPEGKIFRLTKKITIPAGKSLDVQVIADQAGPDYNVPPNQGWTVPGITKGTTFYNKLSVGAKTSMTGGASGNQVVPTANDIKNAKSEIETDLLNALKSKTLLLSSKNLILLDKASTSTITNETINSQVDKDNNFSIFAAGKLSQLVFDKTMLEESIMQLAAGTSTASVKIDDFALNYGTSTADLAAGKMSFPVSGQVIYEPKIDFDAFKNDVLGKDAGTLKTMLFALPGLQKANISLWPFWVNSVPTRVSKVNINVE